MTASTQAAPLDRAEYGRLVDRARGLVEELVPPGAVVAVVSRGDPALVELDGREGWHFPQAESGVYAGHHPTDSADAIAHLEALREKGAAFLLVPTTSFWWFEHYRDFKRHLDGRYRLAAQDDAGALYALSGRTDDEADPSGLGPLRRELLARQIQEVIAATLPDQVTVLVLAEGQPQLSQLVGRQAEPFWQEAENSSAPRLPDADEAIAHLEARRADGAGFLVVSATAFHLLDQLPLLKRHLERRHRLAVEQPHLCQIYELSTPSPAPSAPLRRSGSILGWFRRA